MVASYWCKCVGAGVVPQSVWQWGFVGGGIFFFFFSPGFIVQQLAPVCWEQLCSKQGLETVRIGDRSWGPRTLLFAELHLSWNRLCCLTCTVMQSTCVLLLMLNNFGRKTECCKWRSDTVKAIRLFWLSSLCCLQQFVKHPVFKFKSYPHFDSSIQWVQRLLSCLCAEAAVIKN